LENPFKKYNCLSAKGFGLIKSESSWLKKHKFCDKYLQLKNEKAFLKNIFNIIDKDKSGFINENDLIFVFLNLDLCNDLNFAK
jgi:hypothetical protein